MADGDVDCLDLRAGPLLRGGLGQCADPARPGPQAGIGEQTERTAGVLNGDEDTAALCELRCDAVRVGEQDPIEGKRLVTSGDWPQSAEMDDRLGVGAGLGHDHRANAVGAQNCGQGLGRLRQPVLGCLGRHDLDGLGGIQAGHAHPAHRSGGGAYRVARHLRSG